MCIRSRFAVSFVVGCLILGLAACTNPTLRWDKKIDQASSRFIVLSDFNEEAVLDLETGLVWERSSLTNPETWQSAVELCYEKKIGERMGWRLPTFEELSSLVDGSVKVNGESATLPPGHPFNMVPQTYWTITSEISDPAKALEVNFIYGTLSRSGKGAIHYVWCVRSGHGYDPR